MGRLVVELERHADSVQNAIFTYDDLHVVSVSVDKRLFISEIIEEQLEGGGTKYRAKTIHKMEIKNFLDIVLTSHVLVCVGKMSMTVYNLQSDELMSECLQDPTL